MKECANIGAKHRTISHTVISFVRSMAQNMGNTHFSISMLYVNQTRRERPEIFLASCDVRDHAVLKTLSECSLWL
jgi:hypothetical protein